MGRDKRGIKLNVRETKKILLKRGERRERTGQEASTVTVRKKIENQENARKKEPGSGTLQEALVFLLESIGWEQPRFERQMDTPQAEMKLFMPKKA